MNRENIKVQGHRGTWYVIDEMMLYGKRFYLLEHEKYGEDAPCVAIREDGTLLLDNISNGIDEVYEYLEENPLMA